ncbi:hypothetical protein [Comamonas resistens]|uniref:hypothetical protein n=1 Tax=Comamonas resistens TaxID=3046670 RepID=UPI0039BCB892
MKNTYISCEYILSPILSSIENFEESSLGIIFLKKILEENLINTYFEYDIVGKLNSNNLFPTEKAIQSKINDVEDCIFSPKDLSRSINWILSNIDDNEISEGIIDWQNEPNYEITSFIYKDRNDDLKILIDSLIIHLENTKKDGEIIIHSTEELKNSISLNSIVKDSDPKILNSKIYREINLKCNIFKCIQEINFLDYFRASIDKEDLKACIFSELMKRHPEKCCLLRMDQIYFHSGFLDSARRNQALDGNFSQTTFEKIIFILEQFMQSKYLTPYRESASSNKQKTFNESNAYREHITSSGVGLRLMYWIKSKNIIEFSRVGPKHELIINDPEFL